MSFPSAFRPVLKSAIYQPSAPKKRAHVDTLLNPKNGTRKMSCEEPETSFADSMIDSQNITHLQQAEAESDPEIAAKLKARLEPITSQEAANELSDELSKYVLDLLILEQSFEAHAESRILEQNGESIDVLLPSTSAQAERTDATGKPKKIPTSDEVVVQCPECSNSLAVKVFAQHLEQHSGGGRHSFRTAKKKLAEEQRLKSMRIGSDEDNAEDGLLLSPPSGDDDDWNTARKKRRPPAKNRKKKTTHH